MLQQPRPPQQLTDARLLDQPPLGELLRLRSPWRVQEQIRHEPLPVPALTRIPALANRGADNRGKGEREARGDEAMSVLGGVQPDRQAHIGDRAVLKD